jgi:hypothetical protein
MPQIDVRPFMAAENACGRPLRQGLSAGASASAFARQNDFSETRPEPDGFERSCFPGRQTTGGLTPQSGMCVMSFEAPGKSRLHLEFRPVETSPDGTRVFMLLPTLEELLGEPGFGRRNPIFLPGRARPLDGWALFGSVRDRGLVLH